MKLTIALTLYILGGIISMYYFGIQSGCLERALKRVRKQYGANYDKVMNQNSSQILCSILLMGMSMLWPLLLVFKFLQLFKKR